MKDSSHKLDSRTKKIIAVVLLGPFMTSLDSTVVNVSLPILSTELHASVGLIQWVISGYLLALALTLPMSGWLVDRLGAKRVYLCCFAAFTASSVLCGTAQSSHSLIFYRVLQGMTGGLLAPMAQMMMARVAGKHLAKVMGMAVMPILLAPILGPAIAGIILQHASWRWLFYLNLPIGLLALIFSMIILPEDDDTINIRPFDFRGFLLLSPGLAFFLYGLEGGKYIFIIVAIILLSLFLRHALRSKEAALIDIHLFKTKTYSAAAVTQFLANGVTFSGQMLIPLFLINQCHLSPTETGWLLAPMGLGMMVTYPSMGFLTDRFGCRSVSANGALIAFVATLPFIWMSHFALVTWVLYITLFIRGMGLGGINIPSMAAAYASIPPQQISVATTTINIVQRIGGPIATTLVAVFMEMGHKNHTVEKDIFTGAFILLCIFQFLNIVAARFLPKEIGGNVEASEFQAMEGLMD